MKLRAMLAILAMASLGAAYQSEAFKIVRPGVNDPKTLVDKRMHAIPAKLKLKPAQRMKLREVYLDLATSERDIINSPGPRIRKVGRIRELTQQTDTQVKSLLSAKQYHLLKQWETSQHQVHRPKR